MYVNLIPFLPASFIWNSKAFLKVKASHSLWLIRKSISMIWFRRRPFKAFCPNCGFAFLVIGETVDHLFNIAHWLWDSDISYSYLLGCVPLRSVTRRMVISFRDFWWSFEMFVSVVYPSLVVIWTIWWKRHAGIFEDGWTSMDTLCDLVHIYAYVWTSTKYAFAVTSFEFPEETHPTWFLPLVCSVKLNFDCCSLVSPW